MTDQDKITTRFTDGVETPEALLKQMPSTMAEWMRKKAGNFTHEVRGDGSVIITPETPPESVDE